MSSSLNPRGTRAPAASAGATPPRHSHSPHSVRTLSLIVLPALALAACGVGEPPTAPDAPAVQAEASAVELVVNSLADPGDGTCNAAECTLREAIAAPGTTRIRFAGGLAGAIALARPGVGGGVLAIERSLRIVGPAGGIVIRRRGSDPAFRIFRIASGARVTLENLTIRGAKPTGPWGAILNFGTLALTNCKVVDNATGGINSQGAVTLTNVTVADNAGGGLSGKEPPLTVTNSTVSRNLGTGISGKGTITVTNSAVNRNTGAGISTDGSLLMNGGTVAHNQGGGISLTRATATLDGVTIVDNAATGIGMWNSELTLRTSQVSRNAGNGVQNRVGKAIVESSTIADNTGMGIWNDSFGRAGAEVTVTNTTVSGNSGDGISTSDDVEAFASATVVNSTVAFNGGHGVAQHASNGAVLILTNTIVARNGASTAPDVYNSDDFYGLIGGANNLIGDGTGSGFTNVEGNQVGNVTPYTAPIDPLLGPLGNNGGLTPTHALLDGSPAIDAGTSEGCPATDQRGVTRPQGSACDIGSFER